VAARRCEEPGTMSEADERTINIRRAYLGLIAGGTKTIEVRVGYPSMRKIHAGQVLRFVSGETAVRARVVAVKEYACFDAMLDAEENQAIGAEGMTHDGLLAVCREIYPPAKEALGVLAIHLKRLPD
jgi:ASC-1-like (ASCH) protein